MFMKLMKQKKKLLCEYITPTSFLYIYILLLLPFFLVQCSPSCFVIPVTAEYMHTLYLGKPDERRVHGTDLAVHT
jgi:hypothetical protein